MDARERRALAGQLQRGRRGWGMLLPKEAGVFQGKRIGVSARHSLPPAGGEPALTAEETGLIEQIFEHLPKLIARAEREVVPELNMTLDEEDRLARPEIWIDRADEQPGRWTLVVGVAGSDFAWHVEFVRTRFKETWAGD